MAVKGILKFLLRRAFEGLVIVLLIIFMPSIPPNAKFSTPYKVPSPLPLEGKLALNEKLNNVEIWHKSNIYGPEAFAVYDNELYTTVNGGDVVKLIGNHIIPVVKFGKPCKGLYQEKLCGRPLGLAFSSDGTLYVNDAYYGIFKVNVKSGDKVRLVSPDDEIDGKKSKIFNSVAVASNGDLYWTDSSTEFDLQDGLYDMFADGSGRLIHYDAKTKKNTVLIKDLHFANGVNLADDESFVLVNELARSRILRYYLKGPKKGTTDTFLDRVPGLPDNLPSDGQGGFFVPLVVAIDDQHPLLPQILGPFPLIRKFIARILGLVELTFTTWDRIYPNEYAQRGAHFVGHFESFSGLLTPKRVTILHVSKSGEILDSVHGLNGKISGISEAAVYKDSLYLGSPFNDYIARIKLSEIGWDKLAQKPTTKSQTPSANAVPPTQTPPVKQTPPPTTQTPPTTRPPTTKQAPTPSTAKPTQAPPTTAAPSTEKTTKSAPTTPPPATKQATPTTKKPSTATPTATKQSQTKPTPEPPKQKPADGNAEKSAKENLNAQKK